MWKKIKKKEQAGFTLIEMLVATGIMLVVLGGGIAAYINFNEKQKTGASARELQQLLRSAQVKAQVGQHPTNCVRLDAYSVEGLQDGGSAQLVAQCSNPTTEIVVETLDFPTGVVLSNNLDIDFKTLHGGVTGSGTVQLQSTFGYVYSFTVDEGGAIGLGEFREGQ